VAFEREALLGVQAVVKRALDIVGAAALLLVSSPVLGVAEVASRLTRRRTLIERSPRVGLGERVFGKCGLRDELPQHALRRWADRHGLSSVPELLNVFSGDMSIVGPAPLTPDQAVVCDPRERVRFDARPGITGLAQVASAAHAVGGGRALDAYYVQNWSLGGDLRIIVRWWLLCLAGRCAPRDESPGR
jgi:sugar transferase EpsL